MTDHESFENLILRLPADDLTDSEKAVLWDHLRICPDCRRLFEAMAAATEELETELPVPDGLHEAVMARIRAGTKAPTPRRAPWRAVAGIAAAFVLVAGGLFAARDRLSAPRASAASGPADFAAAAEADLEMPVPEPMEAAEYFEYEEAVEAPAKAPAEPRMNSAMDAAEAEAARAEPAAAAFDTMPAADPVYPLDAPASVPKGREADFEALLGSVLADDAMGAAVIAYVEYRGVIYEFSSDGACLYWRDAAEGAEPILSPADPDALWDILG